jgi:hypothetical protein
LTKGASEHPVDLAEENMESYGIMAPQALDDIENAFARLSPEAQLSLLERLVHRIRVDTAGREEDWLSELSAMAADPEVQRELGHINREFSAAEMDGLENR